MLRFQLKDKKHTTYLLCEFDDGYCVFAKDSPQQIADSAFYRFFNGYPANDWKNHLVVTPRDIEGVLMVSKFWQ